MKNFSFAWPSPSLMSSNSALMLVITETPAITVSIFLQVMAWIGLRKPQVNSFTVITSHPLETCHLKPMKAKINMQNRENVALIIAISRFAINNTQDSYCPTTIRILRMYGWNIPKDRRDILGMFHVSHIIHNLSCPIRDNPRNVTHVPCHGILYTVCPVPLSH